jgi:hypothetical protein
MDPTQNGQNTPLIPIKENKVIPVKLLSWPHYVKKANEEKNRRKAQVKKFRRLQKQRGVR